MKNILYILFFMVDSHKVTAQITYIPDQGFEQVLIDLEIDSEDLAQNNEYPYSAWNMIYEGHVAVNFSDECNLSILDFTHNKVRIYPYPVSDILYFDTTDTTIYKVVLFDISGRKILEQNQVNNISVSHLQKGSYILKIFSDKGVHAEKIIIK